MRGLFPALVVASLLTVAADLTAAETACDSLTVVATFSSRTTLRVSSEVLRFAVANADVPATASIDFVAAARTHADGAVVLSIEPVGQPGAESGTGSVSFSGDGEGTRSGTVTVDAASIAGQWIGSGVRRGRLVFTLRSNSAGNHVVPIRFVLSAP